MFLKVKNTSRCIKLKVFRNLTVLSSNTMTKLEVNIAELVNILSSINCPFIIRSDDWWIEELLFQPGQPRTDLMCWLISQVVNRSFPISLNDLDSTDASTISSNGRKFPETEEGIFEYLRSAGICNNISFVKGSIPKEDQIKCWSLMIKPCQYLHKPNLNTNIAFGTSSLNSIISMDNFSDVYNMKPALLPADLKSEIQQFTKEKKENKHETVINYDLGRLNDKLFVQNISDQANRLKSASDELIEVFKSEFRVCFPKQETSHKLLDIGDEINSITNKMSTYKKGMDSLLDMHQNNSSEINRKKTEQLLQRSIKDKSFPPFHNISSDE